MNRLTIRTEGYKASEWDSSIEAGRVKSEHRCRSHSSESDKAGRDDVTASQASMR